MKIVYTLFSNLVCGGHIVALQHAVRLSKRGYQVEICLLDKTIAAHANSFAWFPNFKLNIFHYDAFPEDIDINVATFWATAIPVLQSSAKHKVYFVQLDETRFYDAPVTKSRVALTYLLNVHYMTEAKWIREWLKNEFGHNAEYIPNGFDPEIVHKAEPLQERNAIKPRILIEGSISSPFKRVKESIEICQDLNCEIWCVSNDGQLPGGLRVDRFFHKVDFDKMKYIYSSCDILLKLSTVEGVFGPPLEMMACGGVCVVSDVSGYDEYITDRYNALVIPNGDLELAKAALRELIDNPDLYLRLQENGRLTAESMEWDSKINKLESFFERLAFSSPREIDERTLENLISIDKHLKELEIINTFLPTGFLWNLRSLKKRISSYFKV